jgi:hypothetical protein
MYAFALEWLDCLDKCIFSEKWLNYFPDCNVLHSHQSCIWGFQLLCILTSTLYRSCFFPVLFILLLSHWDFHCVSLMTHELSLFVVSTSSLAKCVFTFFCPSFTGLFLVVLSCNGALCILDTSHWSNIFQRSTSNLWFVF